MALDHPEQFIIVYLRSVLYDIFFGLFIESFCHSWSNDISVGGLLTKLIHTCSPVNIHVYLHIILHMASEDAWLTS